MITIIRNTGIILFALLIGFSSCKKTEYSFGDVKTPSGLTLTAIVEGVDGANPNGNGSGYVVITTSGTGALTYKIDFGGAAATVVNNPNPSGINTSTKVGRMIKGAPEVWAGSFIELVNPINFSTLRTFKVKVYSPRIGARLLLKVENASNGGIFFEKEATTTTANTWEELTFDYTGINAGNFYSKIVLIFDLGASGDGSPNFTFYFDDIRLN